MQYVTLALSGGGLIAAFVMSLLWARAKIEAARANAEALEYGGRLRLAQNTILRNKVEARAAAALDQRRLADIARLEAILASHPELAGDQLRDLGRRVLPLRDGSGSAPAVPRTTTTGAPGVGSR